MGDEVVVLGLVKRRFYSTGGATASATEVIAHGASLASREKQVAKLVDQAIGRFPVLD